MDLFILYRNCSISLFLIDSHLKSSKLHLQLKISVNTDKSVPTLSNCLCKVSDREVIGRLVLWRECRGIEKASTKAETEAYKRLKNLVQIFGVRQGFAR